MRFTHTLALAAALAFALPAAAHAQSTATPTSRPTQQQPTRTHKAAKAGQDTSGMKAMRSSADTGTAMAHARAPKGATARCKDNTYSMSTSRTGACSAHGGVAAWLKHGKAMQGEKAMKSKTTKAKTDSTH